MKSGELNWGEQFRCLFKHMDSNQALTLNCTYKVDYTHSNTEGKNPFVTQGDNYVMAITNLPLSCWIWPLTVFISPPCRSNSDRVISFQLEEQHDWWRAHHPIFPGTRQTCEGDTVFMVCILGHTGIGQWGQKKKSVPKYMKHYKTNKLIISILNSFLTVNYVLWVSY